MMTQSFALESPAMRPRSARSVVVSRATAVPGASADLMLAAAGATLPSAVAVAGDAAGLFAADASDRAHAATRTAAAAALRIRRKAKVMAGWEAEGRRGGPIR